MAKDQSFITRSPMMLAGIHQEYPATDSLSGYFQDFI